GHAEPAVWQLCRNVFAGLAGDGQFKIVDCRRAVQDHGAEQPAMNPIDQVPAASGFDDMPAQGGDHGLPIRISPAEGIADPAHLHRSELSRQSVDPVPDPYMRFHRMPQVFHENLAGPRLQVIRLESVEIEWLEAPNGGMWRADW